MLAFAISKRMSVPHAALVGAGPVPGVSFQYGSCTVQRVEPTVRILLVDMLLGSRNAKFCHVRFYTSEVLLFC